MQYSVSIRNNQLDVIESTIGASAKLRILTGTKPTNCSAAQTGTLLCEIALPADWMSSASNGSKSKSGTWSGVGAGAGDAGYFRVVNSDGSVCHIQGTVTLNGGGGDMTVDNTNIAVSQSIAINSFTINCGNA